MWYTGCLVASNLSALVASFALVACGSSGDTLFAKGNVNEGGTDGGAGQAGTSGGGSGGNSSASGGQSSGGSPASGGQVSGGGGNSQSGGATMTGGATSADGSVGGSDSGTSDGSIDSSAGGSNGGAVGTGGRATGGRNGAGGFGAGGKGGTSGAGNGGKGGATDAGVLRATPGVIACAGTPCTIAGTIPNVCCSGGLTSSCLPQFPGCVQFGVSYACDDAADCANGNICCGSTLGASCAKTCTGNQFQLCRTNDECKAGECRPVTTAREYSACQ